MSNVNSREDLFNKLRLHAKGVFAKVRGMPDFDHDNPETFRKWRDYVIAYAVACNARSAHPLSEAEADVMGEQCGLWFWNTYHPKAFYEEKAKRQSLRYGRPIHEVIESLRRGEYFE